MFYDAFGKIGPFLVLNAQPCRTRFTAAPLFIGPRLIIGNPGSHGKPMGGDMGYQRDGENEKIKEWRREGESEREREKERERERQGERAERDRE